MSASVLIRCPHCRQVSQVRESSHIGKRVRCPHCGQSYEANPEPADRVSSSESSDDRTSGAAFADQGASPVDDFEQARRAFEREVAALLDEGLAAPRSARRTEEPIADPFADALESSPVKPAPGEPPRRAARQTGKDAERRADEVQRPRARGKPHSKNVRRGGRAAKRGELQEGPQRPRPAAEAVPTDRARVESADGEPSPPAAPPPIRRASRKSVPGTAAGAGALANRRRRPAAETGFWTINRVAAMLSALVAVFGWSLAAAFYANADGAWRTMGVEEALDDAALLHGVQPIGPRFYSQSGHSISDFVFNAIRQLPRAFDVARWSIRSVPWLVAGACFVEGLIVYFWLTSRKLAAKWAEIDKAV